MTAQHLEGGRSHSYLEIHKVIVHSTVMIMRGTLMSQPLHVLTEEEFVVSSAAFSKRQSSDISRKLHRSQQEPLIDVLHHCLLWQHLEEGG